MSPEDAARHAASEHYDDDTPARMTWRVWLAMVAGLAAIAGAGAWAVLEMLELASAAWGRM